MKLKTKLSLLAILLLSDCLIFAQGDPDPTEDPPPTPINTKIILLFIVGLLFAFYSIRKYRRQIK